MRNGKGFTLIELLVVIAIIAILAAILFPVFARAREKARTASCLNNVKQITLGIVMYVQDYDETYPAGYNYAPTSAPYTSANAHTWVPAVMPYIKNDQVMKCPSGRKGQDYGVNAHVCLMSASARIRLAQVKQPAETFLLMDSSAYYCRPSTCYIYSYIPGTACGRDPLNFDFRGSQAAIDDWVIGRHNVGINIGYCDGHSNWRGACTVVGDADAWDPLAGLIASARQFSYRARHLTTRRDVEVGLCRVRPQGSHKVQVLLLSRGAVWGILDMNISTMR